MCARSRSYLGASLLAFILLSLPTLSCGDPLGLAEQRGKNLYFNGTRADGTDIKAFFGEEGIEISGAISTCATCHGHDGTGRPESGVDPSNITWAYLTKNYGHQHTGGRHHPAFTPESLKEYLLHGSYPGGTPGDPTMPRYDLSNAELNDLIAFLRRLGDNLTPGLNPHQISLGVLVPASGQGQALGETIVTLLERYYARANRDGGIHGRKILVAPLRLELNHPDIRRQLSEKLAEQEPFLFLSTFSPGAERPLGKELTKRQIPSVAPMTPFPRDSVPDNRWTFHLWPGLKEQMGVLLQNLARQEQLADPRIALFLAKSLVPEKLGEDLGFELHRLGWKRHQICTYPAGRFESDNCPAAREEQDIVLFLGPPGDLGPLLKHLPIQPRPPHLLLSGPLSGPALSTIPSQLASSTWLSYPTLAFDRRNDRLQDFARLAKDLDLTRPHLQARLNAYIAARLTEHALRAAGRNLDRPAFAAALEGLYKHESGLTPPLTFTRNRHIGAKGSYVVRLDQLLGEQPGPPPRWHDLD